MWPYRTAKKGLIPHYRIGDLVREEEEKRYIEGQVLFENGFDIGGVYDQPENIGFLGYLNTKLPEKNKGAHGLFQIAGQAIDRNKEIGSSS